jgi:hypothetical protein
LPRFTAIGKEREKENPQNSGNVKINRNEWELQGQETTLIGPSWKKS